MLRMRFFLLGATVVLLTAFANAQPQQPRRHATIGGQSPQTQTKSSNQRDTPDQRGTEKSPLFVKTIPPQKTEAETAEEIRQREEKMSTDRWLVKLTIGLVIVGAIQILVFGWQALSLRQTVNQMRESEERQLRAWVFVSQAAVKDPMQHDPIEAHVVIKNAGQTPAYDVRIFGGIIVANWPLDRKLPPIDFSKAASVGTLGPGMDGNQMCALQPQLNASGIQDLNDGKAAIYVFGEIQYRDVFNRTRSTKYRYFTEGAAGVRGISLCSHEQGNEAN